MLAVHVLVLALILLMLIGLALIMLTDRWDFYQGDNPTLESEPGHVMLPANPALNCTIGGQEGLSSKQALSPVFSSLAPTDPIRSSVIACLVDNSTLDTLKEVATGLRDVLYVGICMGRCFVETTLGPALVAKYVGNIPGTGFGVGEFLFLAWLGGVVAATYACFVSGGVGPTCWFLDGAAALICVWCFFSECSAYASDD